MPVSKIPLGDWIESLIEWINEHAQGVLDSVSSVIEAVIEGLLEGFQACPPWLFILLLSGVAIVRQRSWRLPALVIASFSLILNLGYWDPMVETLVLVFFATVTCIVIGIPLGITAAHHPRLESVIRPVLDLMQTIPTFVYLIPTLILFGLGVVPGLISTVIFALPSPIRLTRLGVASTPIDLLEAGRGFGASKTQLLAKIELPHAWPTILTGITQCIMLSLSMVVIAALVGANGLGKPVVRALNTVDVAAGFEAGLCIVLLAVVLDRLFRPSVSPPPGVNTQG